MHVYVCDLFIGYSMLHNKRATHTISTLSCTTSHLTPIGTV